MRQIVYMSCKEDPDLWYKAETRPDDNFRYYAYILCYADDILCVHHDPMTALEKINGYMPLKPSSVGNPAIYLGAKLRRTRLENGIWAWVVAFPNMFHKLSRIVKTIWPKNCTIVMDYPTSWQPIPLWLLSWIRPLQPPRSRVLVILSTPYWCDEVDGWAQLHW